MTNGYSRGYATGLAFPGVNLQGGEGNTGYNTLDTNYTYPDADGEIEYFASKGYKILRIPFLDYRIYNAADIARIDSIVSKCESLGLVCLLDMHEYAFAGNGNAYDMRPGSGTSTTAINYARDAWVYLVNRYLTKPFVWVGLMNEPYSIDASYWINSCAKVIYNAIRAVDPTRVITVPGINWTGCYYFTSNGSSAAFEAWPEFMADPYGIVEVHQYFDADMAGNSTDVVTDIGYNAFVSTTNWARSKGKRMLLGEVGCYTDTASLNELQKCLDTLYANSDVWIGYTYWAGGPWFNNPDPAGGQFLMINPYSSYTGGSIGSPSIRPQDTKMQAKITASNSGTIGDTGIGGGGGGGGTGTGGGSTGGGTGLYDFTTVMPTGVTVNSSPAGFAKKADGSLQAFAANAGRRTDLGIVIEPAATNRIWYSNGLDDFVIDAGTVTRGVAGAPDGSATVMRYTAPNATGDCRIRQYESTDTYTGPGTLSFFYKPATAKFIHLRFNTGSMGEMGFCLNLETDAITAGKFDGTNALNSTGLTITTETFGSWRRCKVTGLVIGGGSVWLAPSFSKSASTTSSTTTTADTWDLWGWQVTPDSKVTTPIVNSAVQNTRSADNVSFTIPAGVSQLIYTFDDNSTQTVSVSPGPYQIPSNLNRAQIKSVASNNNNAGATQTTATPGQTSTATVKVSASQAKAIPAPTQTATARPIASATASQATLAPIQAATGSAANGGVIFQGAQTLLAPAQAASATVAVEVSKAVFLPAPVQSATATVKTSVAGSQALLAPSQAATIIGQQDVTPVSALQTTSAPQQSATATVSVVAQASQQTRLPSVRPSGTTGPQAPHGNPKLWDTGRLARFVRMR